MLRIRHCTQRSSAPHSLLALGICFHTNPSSVGTEYLHKLAISKHQDKLLDESKKALSNHPDTPANSSFFSRIPLLYIVSAFILCIGFLVPLIFRKDSSSLSIQGPASRNRLDPFGDSVYRQEAYYEQLEPGTHCKPKSVFSSDLATTPALVNMALEKEAKRVVAEFDFTKDDVNKAVKEFLAEMEEGLEKQGTQMSQIPTYVTAVPNGTEKVR